MRITSRSALSIMEQCRLDHCSVNRRGGVINIEVLTFNGKPAIHEKCGH